MRISARTDIFITIRPIALPQIMLDMWLPLIARAKSKVKVQF